MVQYYAGTVNIRHPEAFSSNILQPEICDLSTVQPGDVLVSVFCNHTIVDLSILQLEVFHLTGTPLAASPVLGPRVVYLHGFRNYRKV